MGETSPAAEMTRPADSAPDPAAASVTPGSGDAGEVSADPVDPTEIRYRPGIRREGTFTVQYVTIHGYRRAFIREINL